MNIPHSQRNEQSEGSAMTKVAGVIALVILAGGVALAVWTVKANVRDDQCYADVKELVFQALEHPSESGEAYRSIRATLSHCDSPRQAEHFFLEAPYSGGGSYKEWIATVCYIAASENSRAVRVLESTKVSKSDKEIGLLDWLNEKSGSELSGRVLWKTWLEQEHLLIVVSLSDGSEMLKVSQ